MSNKYTIGQILGMITGVIVGSLGMNLFIKQFSPIHQDMVYSQNNNNQINNNNNNNDLFSVAISNSVNENINKDRYKN